MPAPKRPAVQAEKPFYEIKAAAAAGDNADTTEVWIYDEIGPDWYGETVAAKTFCQEIAAIDTPKIALHVNSPGGSVWDGAAIYNALKNHPAEVTTYIDGLAASIASVVALAGDTVVMAENAMFMIHNPWTIEIGDAEQMRKTADVLDKIGETIVNVYESRTGKPRDEITAAMSEESWLTADEALEWGFVDEVTKGVKAAALSSFDLKALGFRKVPAALASASSEPVGVGAIAGPALLEALSAHEPAPAAEPVPDVVDVGRTLSAANEEKLRQAADLINEVLDSADSSASARAENGDSGSIVDSEEVAAMLRTVFD